MCPNPSAKNLNGEIRFPPTCGANYLNSRCPDGQCCDASGVCGPVPSADGVYREIIGGIVQIVTYEEALAISCANNQGDWSYVPCDSNILTFSFVFLAILALF